MLLRADAGHEPEPEPDEAQRAGDDERPLPAVFDGDEWDDERPGNRADVRAAVEDAGRKRALTFRKPLGDRLNGSGEVARLAQAEREARRAEAEGRARQRMAHRRDRPENDGEGEAFARPEPIHQVADDQESDGVSRLKDRVDE